MDERSFDRIVGGLYAAATGGVPWSRALDDVARALDAWHVQLVGLAKPDCSIVFSHDGGPAGPEIVLDYVTRYHRLNPRIAPMLALGPDDWLHDHEAFDETFVASHPFFREFLIPHGGRWQSSTKVIEESELLVLFGATRGRDSRAFDGQECAVLERVKRHLREAVAIEHRLHRSTPDVYPGVELLNAFARPMILIDPARDIRFANAAGRRLLTQADCVVERNGALRCRDAEGDQAFSEALRELGLTERQETDELRQARRFVRVRTQDGAPVVVYLVALRPATTLGVFGHDPLALVFFHDFRDGGALDPLVVGETFDLTPAEARLAVALASGMTLQQVSERHGVSILTVRAQLRAVLAKTNTTRQAELMRILVGMPMTGPRT